MRLVKRELSKLVTDTGAVKHYKNGQLIYIISARREFVPCTTREEAKRRCPWAKKVKQVQGGFWCSAVEKTSSSRADKRGHWPEGKRRSDLTEAQAAEIVALVRHAQNSGMSLHEMERRTGVVEGQFRRWLKGDHWPTSETAKLVRRGLRKFTGRTDLTAVQQDAVVSLVRRAHTSGMSLRLIESKTGVSWRELSKWLRTKDRPTSDEVRLVVRSGLAKTIPQQVAPSEPRIQYSLRLPNALIERMRHAARQQRCTIQVLVQRLLENGLRSDHNQGAKQS